MAYSDFTIALVKRKLGVKILEGQAFLPSLSAIKPSSYLKGAIDEGLPLVLAKGSEKARSELIIAPILLEVRRVLKRQVSLFSGEDFSVNSDKGLTGICDFLLSRSAEQLEIEAPAVLIVEAKKADLNSGLGQCIAEMVAAWEFNQSQEQLIEPIYGCVTSGTAWKFLRLRSNSTVDLDLNEYPLLPIEQILSILIWMVS